MEVGGKLIIGERNAAGIWDVQPDNQPDYKYDYPILCSYPPLSSTLFDRIKIDDTSFIMEFPKIDLQPGTQAQLGQDHFDEVTNQIWVITKSESCPRDLSHFYTLTLSLE